MNQENKFIYKRHVGRPKLTEQFGSNHDYNGLTKEEYTKQYLKEYRENHKDKNLSNGYSKTFIDV